MKRVWRWAVSMLLVAAMVLSLPAGALPASAAGSLPTEVKYCEYSYFYSRIDLGFNDGTDEWLNAVNKVVINDSEFAKVSSIGFSNYDSSVWTIGTGRDSVYSNEFKALQFTDSEINSWPATVVVSADGYRDVTLEVSKAGYYSYTAEIKNSGPEPEPEPEENYTIAIDSDIENGSVEVDKASAKEGDTVTVTATPDSGYDLGAITVKDASDNAVTITDGQFTMPASNVTVSATFVQQDPSALKEIALNQVAVSESSWRDAWYFTIRGDGDYVGKITALSVNGTAWEQTSYGLYTGGKYILNESENRIEVAEQSYGSPEAIKSGDVVTITADGYKPLTFKFINVNGKVSLEPDDGKGDNYELHVKLVGTFDSAITGQDYDAVSGATGMAGSTTKYSDVTVYGALVEKGTQPSDSDWKELQSWTSGETGIDLDPTKCRVIIEPDTENGTAADADSGMSGVYFVISSDLTLSGTAKDVGRYLVSITVADEQGRTATSNQLPFRIYSGEEYLADQMVTDNMVQTQDGKYMWDIMEPWAIKNFGSNVDGEENSVRVLPGLKAWYGSHTSGTYGYLGYDIPWKDVENGDIPQTLYIPSGCDLTIVNMKILSSVRIVIEEGGKLTLRDSVVQGIIDVEKGGTFSMNYDSYNKEFLTGASVCGQIRLQDGAILENAAIYSHANYVANGNLTDRTTTEPVVTTTGNVTIKGDVYIEGDGAGRDCGQTGLLVKDGTLTVGDGSTLVVIGGESMNGWDGGTAIRLENGTITGAGKLVALGGESGPVTGDGGDAVSGNGTVSTAETFLRGATAYERITPGKAVAGDKVKVDSDSVSIEDGVRKDLYGDPYADLYWNTGYDAQPPLHLYTTTPVQRYKITVVPAENGEAAADAETAKAGAVITITTTPDDGYELQSLKVTDAQGQTIATERGKSRMAQSSTFTMPASDVTVTAAFVKTSTKDDTDKGSDSGKDSGSHKHSGSSSSDKSSGSTAASTSANTGANAGTNVAAGTVAGTAVNTTVVAGAGTGTAADATANSADAQSGANAGSTAAANANGDHVGATGDDSRMMLWFTIMVISAGALVVTGKNMFHR